MPEQRITRNKVVHLTYTILDAAGTVFEQIDMPVGYIHGVGGPLFEPIETALEGKQAGDLVEVTLTEAFGPHRPELTFTDDLENVPRQFRHIGAEVQLENEHGEAMQFRVTRILDGKLTIDANHPLAGQDPTFVVTVVSVRDASMDEIVKGMPFDSNVSNSPD